MNKISISLIMLGLGAIMYAPKANAAALLSFPQLFKTPTETKFISLLTQVNNDNSVVATSGWKQFYSDEGNFSIFVPSKSITNLNSKSEEYSINIYSADTKNSSYIVGYVDYHHDLTKLPLKKVYDKFLKDFLGSEVKFINRQKIYLGKYPGIEVEYQNDNPKILAKSRLFLVDKRLYVLDISNYKAGDAQQFFNSFQLENKVKERETIIAIK